MKILTSLESMKVSGATIVNNLPSGTQLKGLTKEYFDLTSGVISSVLLFAWEERHIGCDVTKTPYYFNDQYYSSMPEIPNNSSQKGIGQIFWTGYVA